MKNILRSGGVLVLAILSTLITFSPVQAAAVQPLVFDLYLSPGETSQFEILVSAEETQEIVDMALYSIVQEPDGNLQYIQETTNPVHDWICLESDQLIIPPGEQHAIQGEVTVPFSAGGTYVLALMVEPQNTHVAGQVTFRFRYAVRVVINVERPGLRPDLSVDDFDILTDDEGLPSARTTILNTSNLLYPIAAEMTVRDENRALIERIVFGQGDEETGLSEINIYPGAELWLDGNITKPLFPGTYDLRVFVRFANGRQKVYTEQLVVEEGDFAYAAEDIYLSANTDILEGTMRPGGASSHVLELTNNSNEPITVALSATEIVTDYERSIFEHCSVELRTDDVIEIEPRRTARAVLIVRSAREATDGGYYGYISATAYSQEEEQLGSQDILLKAVVGDEFQYDANVLSTAVSPLPEGLLLSTVVENLSTVDIAPTGVAYLKASTGEIMRTLRLELQEGVDHILPHQSGYLTTDGWQVELGEYTAEIRIFSGSTELTVSEETIIVPQLEEDR